MASRRTTAGVTAVVAAALGVTLLTAPWEGSDEPASRAPAKAAAPLDETAAQVRARATGKRVEVTSLTSATSTTYALPDGTLELTAHAAPIRAKVDGRWMPIDTTLAPTDKGWAPKAATDPVVFHRGTDKSENNATGKGKTTAMRASFTVARNNPPANAATAQGVDETAYTDLVTFASQGHELTMGWPGPLPEPVIEGPRALYRGVFDDVDLLLTARDSGFSHVLIVHTPEAAANPALATLSYQLTSPDLTFHLDPVTQVVTGRNGKGEDIAVSPTPYMWDSAGKPAVTEGPDPEPSEPAPDPEPSYSEDPREPLPDNPTADPNGPGHPTEPAPDAAPSTQTDAVHSAHRSTTRAGIPPEVFTLTGLLGPQPGTHSAVGKAALDGQGSTSAELHVTPDRSLLTASDTVWPVFIDPSITGKTKNWTTVYEKYPTSSFYDGTNYNTGTTEARVGFESTTRGLSRSYFRLGWTSSIAGATVSDAVIRLRETYSWSCEAREMQIWKTGGISPSTTWNHQPSKDVVIGKQTFAHGYNSNCPDEYVPFDADNIAQQAANEGWTAFTMGLFATNESSSYSWKKFVAEGESAPKITIKYNRKPKEPWSLAMDPGPDCDTTAPYASVGKSDLTFSARSSDPDPNDLAYLEFAVWEAGTTTRIDEKVRVDTTGKASLTLDGEDGTETRFTNGKTYFWGVRAIDTTLAASTYAPPGTVNCGFVYDSTAPNSPKVSSDVFPADDGSGKWSDVKFGSSGQFTFEPEPSGESIAAYEYSINSLAYDKCVKISGSPYVRQTCAHTSTSTKATVPIAPTTAALNVLYVRAYDNAGNASPPTKYLFYVSPRDTGDSHGDITGDGMADLLAVDGAGNLRSYAADTAGDVNIHAPGAFRGREDLEEGFWSGADGQPALISHSTDWYPGDGINDLIARMPDGKLYVYPGNGYGSFDVTARLSVLMPASAPDPATLTQFKAVGDITGDKRPDALAKAGGQLWAFTGYTGGAFQEATLLAGSGWETRDIVNVADISGDGVADLLWRSEQTDAGLLLRHGKPVANRGVDLSSLGLAASSGTGKDEIYGTSGWNRAQMPMLYGSADVIGDDGIPDLYAVTSAGLLQLYPGGKTAHGTRVTVGESSWTSLKTLG